MIWLLPWDEDASVRHVPWATWTLILLNILAYLFLSPEGGGEAWVKQWGLVAAEPHWYHFITANFVHGDLMHLVGNMFFLLLFGDNVEDAFGPLPFLALYFLGGLVGDIWFVSANAELAIPSVGASGCIAAIAGAYALLFFRSTIGVRVIFVVLPVYKWMVRAPWVLLFWFGADLFRTFYHHGVLTGGGVNYVAHGAGFAFGVAVAGLALVCGVGHRYHGRAAGCDWFGYWRELPPTRRRPRITS